ncbi:uncharacterized protein LOC102485732 isoform X3 [Tupaia chinensis]|uniref:uncharacterized protein LOC102485732 isoform X3 n=1 Tax=Tupaia chinensis TaxID=246437 RepID=UPI000703ED20|nr:uncharacterized protein LOC102485732 isoform X3 [Tupaia chinensis]
MHSSAYQPQSGPWIPPRTPCPLSVHGPRSSPYTGTAGASELALCGDSSKRHRGELQDSERRPERRGFSEKGAHWLPCCLAKGRMKSRFFWCAPAVLTLRPWQSAEPHCVENDRSDKMPSEVPSCCKIVLFLQNKQDNPTKPGGAKNGMEKRGRTVSLSSWGHTQDGVRGKQAEPLPRSRFK